ncbi:NAD(P)-dependent alcohol dehydrogenase [Pseudonocardia sp. WMMC193]|uniref:NAD(P)-dependent alcohol dehydrogenase n=1 Tax=Pseudonocardia sp. WMMC193 TaxID=2911965 RepID=UPI0027E20564|nr:NAD(P)-dependent alcohol dehydrogenase [Pseudonocardia sp. WMMC193]
MDLQRKAEVMRAVVQDRYGGPEVLRSAEIPVPQPGAGRVRVRVEAAGLDRGAWHLMAGMPQVVRLATGVRRPRTPVRGREFAGTVEALGERVTGVSVGDPVFGIGEGCFAEFAVARADRIAPRPPELDATAAAALPLSGLTALQAVRDKARVAARERVLVLGASGGVGSLAVQVAGAFGAAVTGSASPAKHDLVRALGADPVPHDEPGGPYDVIIDCGGHRPLRLLRSLLTPRGRLVIVGSETGGRWLGGTDRSLRAALLSPLVRQRLVGLVSTENAADLRELTRYARPVVDSVLPLAELPAAVRRMLAGDVRGKLVLTP